MAFTTIPTTGLWATIAGYLNDNFGLITSEKAYCDYSTSTELALTNTAQLVTGFTEEITPVLISESSGVFTVNASGIFKLTLERTYENDDNNPVDQVFISIELRKNGTALFTRTLPMSSASANDEPAVLSISTPFLIDTVAGDYFEVYSYATDNGATPQDVKLISVKLVSDLAH